MHEAAPTKRVLSSAAPLTPTPNPLLDVARRILAAAQEHNRAQSDSSTSNS